MTEVIYYIVCGPGGDINGDCRQINYWFHEDKIDRQQIDAILRDTLLPPNPLKTQSAMRECVRGCQ